MSETLTKEMQTVVFALGKEEYGIDISKVQEIIRLPEITKLPNTADYILGIINLRGNIIPVLDPKKKFLGAVSEYGEEARVVVVETGSARMGLVVDLVSEVRKLPPGSVVSPDSLGTGIHKEYLLGIVKLDQRLLILLDVDKVFN